MELTLNQKNQKILIFYEKFQFFVKIPKKNIKENILIKKYYKIKFKHFLIYVFYSIFLKKTLKSLKMTNYQKNDKNLKKNE